MTESKNTPTTKEMLDWLITKRWYDDERVMAMAIAEFIARKKAGDANE